MLKGKGNYITTLVSLKPVKHRRAMSGAPLPASVHVLIIWAYKLEKAERVFHGL